MNKKSFVLIIALLLSGCSVAFAQEAPALIEQGKSLLEQNKTDSAIACFEKVLILDAKNYDALALLCNYYFLTGKVELDKIETPYLAHESPSRMQVAQYNEDLIIIYTKFYSKSENFLIQAYLIRRNDHLDELAGQIADFKERIGIRTPGERKKWFIKKLLP